MRGESGIGKFRLLSWGGGILNSSRTFFLAIAHTGLPSKCLFSACSTTGSGVLHGLILCACLVGCCPGTGVPLVPPRIITWLRPGETADQEGHGFCGLAS